MASGTFKWFGLGLKNMALGNIAWETDTFKIMLTTSAYDPSAYQDIHEFRSEVSGEVLDGTGYTAGGATLGGATASYDATGNAVNLKAPDLVWADSTITNARSAILYKDTLDAATDILVAYSIFDADVSSLTGTFTLNFDDEYGLLKLTAIGT